MEPAVHIPEAWQSVSDDRQAIPGCTRKRQVAGYNVYTIHGEDYLSSGTVRALMRWGDVSHVDPDGLAYGTARGSWVDTTCLLAERGELDWDGTPWEQYFNGVPMKLRGFVEAWERFRVETGWFTTEAESLIVDPWTHTFGYRDRVGHFEGDGRKVVLDIKTSEHIGTSYRLQLASYLDSHETRGLIVQLAKDGTFKLHWLDDAIRWHQRYSALAGEAHAWIAEQEQINLMLETKRKRWRKRAAKGFRE